MSLTQEIIGDREHIARENIPRETAKHYGKHHLNPRGSRFLIVEDDVVFQCLWEMIVFKFDPMAEISWAQTEEGAEAILDKEGSGPSAFDCVIVDVVLAGQKNGVDLWKRYRNSDTQFIFSSSMPFRTFSKLIGEDVSEYQFFLPKPLDPKKCMSYLKMVVGGYSDL